MQDPNTCKWYGTEESGDGGSYFGGGGGGGDGDAWLWLVLGAALAFVLALGAIAFSVRRDLKAERAGTRKKGTWRAHLKLHLAALALVSLCAWLVVWLVVYEKELPEDVVGFAAVVFEVTLFPTVPQGSTDQVFVFPMQVIGDGVSVLAEWDLVLVVLAG